ncbi:hypothetical protein AGMMS49975_12070 [Clostridia bacterium]|nr:hypothetical protein AGMMS49975_12070 [Clostridia bacterium]
MIKNEDRNTEMSNKQKQMASIIEAYVRTNFGDSEANDPSWNIEQLAEHIVRKFEVQPYYEVVRAEVKYRLKECLIRGVPEGKVFTDEEIDDLSSQVYNNDMLFDDFGLTVGDILNSIFGKPSDKSTDSK